MRSSRARFRSLFFILAVCGGAASCSDGNGDSVGLACQVIVRECGVGASESACIDSAGDLPSDCLDCISQHGSDHGCDYATCQRSPSGCRLSRDLLRP